MEAFSRHIRRGSILVHDREKSHHKLVKELGLISEVYDSKESKKLPDSENQLDKANDLCWLLQMFLQVHSGFKSDDLLNYLYVFHTIINPPENKYEKIEKLLNRAICNPILLRYRQ
jgi:hypothetical protein